MNIFRTNLLLKRLDGMVVNEDDKEAWFNNPCMAAYLKLCLDGLADAHKEMMAAKNMNDVCEARGIHRTLSALILELSRVRATSSGGIEEGEAGAIKRQIEELVNESREYDRDSSRSAGDADDD